MMFALGNPEPVTKTLIPASGDRPAVRVTFNPQPSPLSLRAARRAVADVLRKEGDAIEAAGDVFTSELIRHNILSWEGIGDEAGEPIEPTQDVVHRNEAGEVTSVEKGSISAFLSEPRLVEAADREYVMPWAILDTEKNGLSPSANGTGQGATPEGDTVTTSANTDSTDDAATKKPAPRRARTRGTSRKPTKAKPSGT